MPAPNNSPSSPYIKEVSLNNRPLLDSYFNHYDIMKGGNLDLQWVHPGQIGGP